MAQPLFGNLKSSEAENREHDGDLFAKRVVATPTNQQILLEYNTDNTIKYAGFGAKGLAQGTGVWLLFFLQYDGSGNLTSKTTAYDTWSNRASASYS